MIKAIRKPMDEIYALVKNNERILCVGCGGCTSVCFAGGIRETNDLRHDILDSFKENGLKPSVSVRVIERQCNPNFINEIEDAAAVADCIISTGCGSGVQLLAEYFKLIPVFPALNTLFTGIDADKGLYHEKCRSCGDCQLGYTGGICPVTCCSKSLFNGPCGGTGNDGSCELSGDIPCAWNEIYLRLKTQNRLENILMIRPPMNWNENGPKILVQRGFENRYLQKR